VLQDEIPKVEPASKKNASTAEAKRLNKDLPLESNFAKAESKPKHRVLKWVQDNSEADQKKKIYFKSIEAAIPFYQVYKNKLMADKYRKPEKIGNVTVAKIATKYIRRKPAKINTSMPSQLSFASL
jgi:hypothetical protein